jgi:hypothetical protein
MEVLLIFLAKLKATSFDIDLSLNGDIDEDCLINLFTT